MSHIVVATRRGRGVLNVCIQVTANKDSPFISIVVHDVCSLLRRQTGAVCKDQNLLITTYWPSQGRRTKRGQAAGYNASFGTTTDLPNSSLSQPTSTDHNGLDGDEIEGLAPPITDHCNSHIRLIVCHISPHMTPTS
jgi:hypothetical protein